MKQFENFWRHLFSFQWICLSIWTRLTYYQLKKNKAIIAQNAGFTYSCIFKIFKDLTWFIRWTWPIRPSSNPVTYLLKYYPVLRKTAKGSLAFNNLRDFFSQHFVPRSTTRWTALATSAFRSLSRRLPLEETASWDSAVYTLRGHETGLFQWSIILCDFFFLTGICLWRDVV